MSVGDPGGYGGPPDHNTLPGTPPPPQWSVPAPPPTPPPPPPNFVPTPPGPPPPPAPTGPAGPPGGLSRATVAMLIASLAALVVAVIAVILVLQRDDTSVATDGTQQGEDLATTAAAPTAAPTIAPTVTPATVVTVPPTPAPTAAPTIPPTAAPLPDVYPGTVSGTCDTTRSDCFISVRMGPTAKSQEIRRIDEGLPVSVVCFVRGQRVTPSVRTSRATDVWVQDTAGHYMSGAFLTVPGWDLTSGAGAVPC